MKYTQQQILDALEIIRGTCAEHSTCNCCPLGKGGNCALDGNSTAPEVWDLNVDEGVWRAIL